MPLTHTVINKLQPSSASIDTKLPDKNSDGNGLQLWVRYTGVKSWINTYRWQGKQQALTIGTYPVMSLQNAHQRNIEIKRLIANGANLKDHKKEQHAN